MTCPALHCPTQMTHVPHMNESCVSHTGTTADDLSHRVFDSHDSCLTYDWAMAHIWMSHGKKVNGSCLPHTGATADDPSPRVFDSCITYDWVMAWMSHGQKWMSHVSHIQVLPPMMQVTEYPTPDRVTWHYFQVSFVYNDVSFAWI